jgi:hypothetical protein
VETHDVIASGGLCAIKPSKFEDVPRHILNIKIWLVSFFYFSHISPFKELCSGRKRASHSETAPSTRASKAAKTDPTTSPSKTRAAKKGQKVSLLSSHCVDHH